MPHCGVSVALEPLTGGQLGTEEQEKGEGGGGGSTVLGPLYLPALATNGTEPNRSSGSRVEALEAAGGARSFSALDVLSPGSSAWKGPREEED
ncbi:hypothetical protein NQZ68_028230 [Dissostichus eleginoides]|nr:hypothetical protein NQZ68_028230 [Dissostichus eleginoides]